jgi:hypothetical protein
MERSPIVLRIAASSILLNGLSVAPADVLSPRKIKRTHFDKMMKEQVVRGTDGAIFKVIEEIIAPPDQQGRNHHSPLN